MKKLVLMALVITALSAFDLRDRTTELIAMDGYDWNRLSLRDKEFFAYGWMLANFALRVDAGHHLNGRVGELLEHYGPYPHETAWHFVDLINELYEQPGFLDVPLGVAAQLRHEYVSAIRDGARRPPRIR